MFITKRKLKVLIQETITVELKSIAEGFRRQDHYVSVDQTCRYLNRFMSENLSPELRKITDKEEFLDEIIKRIQTKQL